MSGLRRETEPTAASRTRSAIGAALAGVLATASCEPAANAQATELPIRGVVRAINQVALSTDLPMRIAQLPFREGHRFRAGDLLVAFDCRRQHAELAAVRGVLREAELNLASSVSLDQFKAIGRNDVEIARARLEKAQGELRSLEARVEDCEVKAPFSGRVSEAPLRSLEFTVPHRPYLSIVEDANNEIEMIVPSALLAMLTIGQSVAFRVDELADTPVAAVIASLGAVVDPVSKTAKVIASVRAPPAALTAGMSGTAVFHVERVSHR